MRIGILSFRPPNKRYTRQELRLAEEAKKKKHQAKILRIQNCVMVFDQNGKLELRYGKNSFPELDIVIPRPGISENISTRTATIEQLQLMGVPMLNDFRAINRAKSKLHELQILSYYGIPIVKTVVIHDREHLDFALSYLGSFPIVIKTISGFGGEGVAIVESKRGVESAFGFIKEKYLTGNAMLLQEYVPEAEGKDIRLFVVGEKVVGAMQRHAAEGDFRSNIHQGGSGKSYTPNWEEKHLAIRATKAIGLEIAGVDLIETKNGPAVMEVNSNPGFEALEKITGLNIAASIIKYAVKFAREYVRREI